jgi:protease-4
MCKKMLLAWVVGLTSFSQAHAAPPGPGPRPLVLPWGFRADLDGVESTVGHAAGLGFLDGYEVGLLGTARLRGPDPVSSLAGLGAMRLGPVGLGLAFSGIADGRDADTHTTRLDIALALRLSDTFALGAQWVDLGSGTDPALDDYRAFHFTGTWRPSRSFSLAFGIDDLDRPILPGSTREVDPTAFLSFGFRPGTERVSFGIDAARPLTDASSRWDLGATVRAMLVPGLWLGGWARYGLDEAGGDGDFQGGLTLGLPQSGVEVASGFDADRDGSRLTTLVKGGSPARPSLIKTGHRVVRIRLSGPLPERPKKTLFGAPTAGFVHWLMALDIVAKDPHVAGLLLQIDAAPSWAQSWELRQAIGRIQKSGKKVLALLTVGDMRSHYLASAADEIHLYAAGGLMMTGLAVTQTYLFGMLDKLGVRADLLKWDEYKSAPEVYMQSAPSEPSREQTRAILDGMYAEWLAAVATGRKLERETVEKLLEAGPQSMHVAKESRLVDGLVESDAIGKLVESSFGRGAVVVDGYTPPPEGFTRWAGKKRIAILPVTGSIVDGPSSGPNPLPIPFVGGETTGDASFIPALEAAVADPDVAGIVIRVDSGGGSAIASDRMHRAVVNAKKRKPIVVSFGDVAASGGYYLAAGVPIHATPVTITGSIGIFAGKVDISGLYALLGLSTHTEKTNARADMMSTFRPYTDEERLAARATLRSYYDRFLEIVSAGRKMTVAEVDAVARGRVWLGSAALERRLVDVSGGLWDAIAVVRKEARIEADEDLGLVYTGTLDALSGLQRFIGGVFFDEPTESRKGDAVLEQLGTALQALSGEGPLAMEPSIITVR